MFLGCFLKKKKEKWHQKHRSFCYKFRTLIPGSDKYFLEVSVHVSLKVATDDSFSDKETMKI